MGKDIAVFVGGNEETATLEQPGKIIVYKKKQGQWQELREKEFTLGQTQGVRELRSGIAEIVEFLADCKVFVGRAITGLPYFELEKASCSVWEFTGKPLEFLDYVLEKEEEAAPAAVTQAVAMPVPEEIDNGCYRISIKEIQETDAGITSKQALQPVLRQGNFNQLEVICNHIPPWLEAELTGGNLHQISKKSAPGEARVIIRKGTSGI